MLLPLQRLAHERQQAAAGHYCHISSHGGGQRAAARIATARRRPRVCGFEVRAVHEVLQLQIALRVVHLERAEHRALTQQRARGVQLAQLDHLLRTAST